jgi:hypothetical protein
VKIWRCPLCDDGKRAPARMRRDNALRYCLTCSGKTGKLVERVCPSAAAERERREAERKAAEIKAKDRAAAKATAHEQTERGRLEAKCREWLKLDAFKDGLNSSWFTDRGIRLRPVQFQIRLAGQRVRKTLQRVEEKPKPGQVLGDVYYEEVTTKYKRQTWSTGHAWYRQRRFVVTAGTDYADALATILHEITHVATADDRGHGPAWRACFADAVEEVTGERPVCTGDRFEYHKACTEVVRRWLGPEAGAVPEGPTTTITPCEAPAAELPSEAS